MPSTQQEKIPLQRACSDLYGAGGEPPGEPPALSLRSAEGARPLSEEVVDGAVAQARLRRSVAGMTDDAGETLIDALLDQLGAERDGLPDELRERLLDGMIAGKRGEREILGQDGVLGEITRRMVQRALEEELTKHLGYPAGQAPPGGAGNSRNGGTPKTLLTDQGAVRIDTPRDRKSRFEPQLVKKGQRRTFGTPWVKVPDGLVIL